MKERAANAMSEVFKKILLDVAKQLKKNPKAELELRYERELVKKLTELFSEGYSRGERDVKSELNKLRKASVQLAADPSDLGNKKNRITKWVKNLFFKVKTTVEVQMDKVTPAYIESKGGVDKYILGFETGFKTEKRQVFREVEAGYVVGRGSILKAAKDEIALYMYSAILDKNLCDDCAPFDGQVMSYRELLDNLIEPY